MAAGAILAVVWPLRRRFRRPTLLLWTVVGLYGAGRFLIFYWRSDTGAFVPGVNAAQGVSLLLVTVAVTGGWRAIQSRPTEAEPALAPHRGDRAANRLPPSGDHNDVKVELLYFDGCPSYEALLPRSRGLLAGEGVEEEVELVRVETPEAAERERFLGSPTLRVDGEDGDPGAAERDDYGLKCRLYRTPRGQSPLPPDEWIRAALGQGT
jgi:hypothetical protein